jgi:Fe-S cluster assembly protein SufD
VNLLDTLARQFATTPAEAEPVQAVRRRAWDTVRMRGVPSVTDEDWKYTDLSTLATQEFRLASPAPAPSTLPLAGLEAIRVVFVNGHLDAAHSDLDRLPPGVTVRTWRELAAAEPAHAARELARYAGDDSPLLANLNAAIARDGVLLGIAAGTVLTTPVFLLFVHTGDGAPTWAAPHVQIDAGAHSRCTIVEMHHAVAPETYAVNALSAVATGDCAQVSHYRVVAEGAAATHLAQVEIDVGRDSEIVNYSLAVGGRLVRVDINCRLAATGGRAVLNGVFIAGDEQHVDHHTRIEHRASHTSSDETYKGIADGTGRGVFNGKIIVRPGIGKIVATQASHNLLLSSTAEIDTKPELEIYADDLSCAHGATVGQLDDDALFYLRARGVPRDEALALLTYGFVEALLEEIPIPALHGLVAARIAADNPMLANLLAGPET